MKHCMWYNRDHWHQSRLAKCTSKLDVILAVVWLWKKLSDLSQFWQTCFCYQCITSFQLWCTWCSLDEESAMTLVHAFAASCVDSHWNVNNRQTSYKDCCIMPRVVGDNVNFDRGVLWLLHTELHWPDWCQDGRVSLWSRSKVLGRLLFPSFWRQSRHGLTVSCCLPVTLRYIWACKAVNHFQLPAWQMDGANDNGHKTICITGPMALRSFMQVTASEIIRTPSILLITIT